ncbi:2-nitropropane dioxygenase [Fictibacillus phosphorivorans]|uniref:Probable nitronate monooxygenase n=1 Tax=Fictibacillus phosphorivorans TaxID=1221500 RepID=A0A163PS72_9BACL|nr:nitronate monooxygenase [Fictibacillus phosphorivorans]KZE64045.1 2-nitropropane dioxygenase [Fictibacillus phosphorivorans]
MSNKLPLDLSNQLSLPVINAPMFLVSSPETVIESCKNGIIGTFPLLNARTSDLLENWMKHISKELHTVKETDPSAKIAPWGVNLIVHRTNKRFDEDLALIKKYEPPVVITSLGNPSDVTKMVHSYGGLVFSDVISLDHARKAAKTGIDGLILVCSGAGGHGGTLNPFAFLKAVKEFWDGMTILAGAISTGEEILAAKILGADLVYMGTRFIATQESSASEEYRQMLIDSTLEDLIYTDAISGIKGNYLLPSLQKAGFDVENLMKKDSIDLSFSESKAKAWKDIWSAGQGVGSVKKNSSIKEVVDELKAEYQQALQIKEENILIK